MGSRANSRVAPAPLLVCVMKMRGLPGCRQCPLRTIRGITTEFSPSLPLSSGFRNQWDPGGRGQERLGVHDLISPMKNTTTARGCRAGTAAEPSVPRVLSRAFPLEMGRLSSLLVYIRPLVPVMGWGSCSGRLVLPRKKICHRGPGR